MNAKEAEYTYTKVLFCQDTAGINSVTARYDVVAAHKYTVNSLHKKHNLHFLSNRQLHMVQNILERAAEQQFEQHTNQPRYNTQSRGTQTLPDK